MDSAALGYGQVTCLCEHTSEHLGSISFGKILDWLRKC